jgi:DNA-binding beta-propeller fold protein YncE
VEGKNRKPRQVTLARLSDVPAPGETQMNWKLGAAVVLLAAGSIELTARSQGAPAVPRFQLDHTWPKPLPNQWQLGPVTGVFVDTRDRIWINSQSDKLNRYDLALKDGAGDCCIASPRVVVFDMAGNVVKSWGGPGPGFEWPTAPHAIYVDHKENVWITANGDDDTHVLKFTNDGKFLLQIGKKGVSKGSNDTANLNKAAGIAVWPATNEVFIGDGYGNRRVIVFDADTGAYKRHWGAYGKRPEDVEPTRKFDGEGAAQFSTVHGLSITPDGIVWVADRVGNRLQQFRIDGTYLKEAFVARKTTHNTGTVYGFSFSRPQATWVYIADGSNKKVHILNRETLQTVGFFGGLGGQMPGAVNHLHGTSVDSQGNVYTGEAAAGARVQRWLQQK